MGLRIGAEKTFVSKEHMYDDSYSFHKAVTSNISLQRIGIHPMSPTIAALG